MKGLPWWGQRWSRVSLRKDRQGQVAEGNPRTTHEGACLQKLPGSESPGRQTLVLWSPNVGPRDLTVLRQVLNDADGGLELFLTVWF